MNIAPRRKVSINLKMNTQSVALIIVTQVALITAMKVAQALIIILTTNT